MLGHACVFVLLAQQPLADASVVRAKLELLFDQFLDAGQPPGPNHNLQAVLQEADSQFGSDAHYALAKAQALERFGQSEAARRTFDTVPDDALIEPADLVRRLTAQYIQDPSRAIALARRLAGSGTPAAHSALTTWVHQVLARHFVPTIAPDAAAPGALVVLDALGQQYDYGGVTVSITAGLRMWARARIAEEPAELLILANRKFTVSDSYGGRYQLLLADILDARKEPELQAAARAIRERMLVTIWERLSGLPRDEFNQPSGVIEYWFAFASSREADAARRAIDKTTDNKQRANLRGKSLMHDSNAATLTINGNRPALTAWFSEAEGLAGRREFLTRDLAIIEQRAADFAERGSVEPAQEDRATVLSRLAQLTLIDGSAVSLLAETVKRHHPDQRWDSYWTQEVLKNSPVLSTAGIKTLTGQPVDGSFLRGRWRLVVFWATRCECQAVRQQAERLVRELGNDVLLLVGASDAVSSRRYFEIRGLHPETMISADTARAALSLPRDVSMMYLVAPDGRYVRLPRLLPEKLVGGFLGKAVVSVQFPRPEGSELYPRYATQ